MFTRATPPVTVTASCTPPSSRAIGGSASASPTVTTMSARIAGRNPDSSARSSYGPAEMPATTNRPSAAVVALRVNPVASCRTVISTPGSRAPDESTIEPDSVAVVCAAASPSRTKRTNYDDEGAAEDMGHEAYGHPGYLGNTANASISISQSELTSALTPTVDRAGLVGFAAVPNTSP